MKAVFFDGYCNLCNGFVDWLARVDKDSRFRFGSLQGETAKEILPPNVSNWSGDPSSVIYFRDGKLYDRSSAILMIFWDLGGLWTIAITFWIIPKCLRDLAYGWVAKNRYRLFGKRSTCRIPSAEERERFLS
jgi:predicted DCC family thiol-disulfide oxidoreductase YuxK